MQMRLKSVLINEDQNKLLMKHFAFSFIFLVMAGVAAYGQDFDAEKAVKKASRDVSSYTLDPANNMDKLLEAKDLVDQAMATGQLDADSKSWYTYGSVYTELLNADVRQLVENQNAPILYKDAPQNIYKGFSKAYETAEKSFERRDAANGLNGIMNNIAYIASVFLSRSEFGAASDAYDALVMSHDFLKANNEESIFTTDEEFQQQMYWGALAAYSAGEAEEAEETFMRLYNEGYDSPDIYSALVEINMAQQDNETADKFISEGLKKYPQDKGLLYAEINRSLAKGELEDLIGKLEQAAQQEPGNVTIPSTMGHVYDQMYQDAVKAGDMEKAETYYENAKASFERSLAIDDQYFDAIYMLGALEYNKAAQVANEVNALADDYSKEGTKKYEAKKAEMMGQFEKALPFFIQAEQINPNDINTLIALREIYARKDMLDKSNEYKQKIESLPPSN